MGGLTQDVSRSRRVKDAVAGMELLVCPGGGKPPPGRWNNQKKQENICLAVFVVLKMYV